MMAGFRTKRSGSGIRILHLERSGI